MDIKSFFRKDINNFKLWPLRPNFLESKEYKEKFDKIDMGESVIETIPLSFGKNFNLKVNYYPGVSKKLISLLSKLNKVKANQVFIGNGSLSLIELLIRLFVDPKDEVIISFPTYPLYEYYTLLARAKSISFLRENYQEVNVKKLKEKITEKTKLIFLDSPSNPFGYLIPKKTIREILDLEIPTVIDEAYVEFSSESSVDLINEFQNLIILRTFSKSFGLAGIRLGYTIASQDITSGLIKIKNPEEVNIVAQYLATEALGKKSDLTKKFIEGRNYLIKNLNIPYLKVYPSQGGYIMIEVLPQSPLTVNQIVRSFYQNKILIKQMDFADLSRSFIRLNIVPINLSKKIISIFKKIYEI